MLTSRRGFILGCLSTTALMAAHRALAQTADLTELSIADASLLLRSRQLSVIDLTQAYLARIDRYDQRINSFITVTRELALAQASRYDEELDRGRWRGPLHGIPIALKDNIDTAGIRTTAASELLADRVAAEDAEVYRRLQLAGAVLLGKLNLHEFAYGGTSAISHFGAVHNPWQLDRIPGGSSGGSAAAVAARLCAAALGTDTLASIRQPAAYCGVTGLKATHGLTSIRGIIPVAESLDHVGPLCRSVEDCALVLQTLAGSDPLDPVSVATTIPDYSSAVLEATAALRLGIPRGAFYEDLDPDIASAVDAALMLLTRLTTGRSDVSLPPTPSFVPLLAESYAYHAQSLTERDNHGRYDPVTLERLLAAGKIPTTDYIAARRELALCRNAISAVFDEVDLLVTPTTPRLPERIANAENPANASGAELSVRNTAPFNLYGIPTISIPCGYSRSGLPIGLQISGPRFGELPVLAMAHAYQQATDWHRRMPSLS